MSANLRDELPPVNKYICEARNPGAKTHEFRTPDEDSARAMCDVHGWEYIRCYEPGSHADRPKDAVVKGDRGLTPLQKKCLVTEARKTWDHLTRLGLTDDTFDTWRRELVKTTVGLRGLSACQNRHYRKLLSTFRAARGAEDPGGKIGKPRRQSGEGGDTLERREQLIVLLAHELQNHARRVEDPKTETEVRWAACASMKGGVICESYLMAIAKGKNSGTPLVDMGCLIKLTAARLEELLFTLRNRIMAREGRGDVTKRNKKQGGK